MPIVPWGGGVEEGGSYKASEDKEQQLTKHKKDIWRKMSDMKALRGCSLVPQSESDLLCVYHLARYFSGSLSSSQSTLKCVFYVYNSA